MKKLIFYLSLISILVVSCVSSGKFNRVNASHNSDILNVENNIKKLNSSISILENKISKIEKENLNEISILKNNISDYEEEMKILNEKLDNMKELVNQLRIEVASLKKEINDKNSVESISNGK